ncbi:MAG: hypothetical protein Kow0042_00710 [Calditrichia bacterium]
MKRRDFLHQSLMIGAGFSFLPLSTHFFPLYCSGNTTSSVVQVSNNQVRLGNDFDENALEQMLDLGLSALDLNADPIQVWKNLFSKNDVVGIKVNCLSGKRGSSHPVLIETIIEKLKQAGVKPGNIIIWDRLNDDLESAGYSLNWKNSRKVRCFGNDVAGFDNRLYIKNSVGSLITRTVTDYCSALINVPVLKDHGIVGVTLSMKNFFGAIHNPNKYHSNVGNPFVADLYSLDVIRRKVRLTICDALDAQYEGGPPFKPQWSWPMNTLFLAVDGVALDRVGWEVIESKRAEKNFPPLEAVGRKPQYIITAGEKGIGQSDLNRINWIKLEMG